MARKSTYAYTEKHEASKAVCRGLNYKDGEWTGLYFQPVLLCTHRVAELRAQGWIVEQSQSYYNGEGIISSMQFFPRQKCEVTA